MSISELVAQLKEKGIIKLNPNKSPITYNVVHPYVVEINRRVLRFLVQEGVFVVYEDRMSDGERITEHYGYGATIHYRIYKEITL